MISTQTKQFKFTKSKLDKLPFPSTGVQYYNDSEEKGLKLYITTSGSITFCYRKKINGKDQFERFGQYGEITIDSARKKCVKLKSDISENSDFFNKGKIKKENQTLKDAVLEYIELHSEHHKSEKLLKAEKRYLELYLGKVSKLRVISILKEDIIRLHNDISVKNGPYVANRVIAFLRAMFNWKIENQNWDVRNPATKIKLNREVKKDRFLQKNERKRFVKALDREPNEIARDILFVAILTGVRKGNILSMKWEDIDFDNRIWRIPKTKNYDSHNVPLLNDMIDLLNNRMKRNPKIGFNDSPYVFPSKSSASGHFSDPKKAWRRILKDAEIENLTIHDLRRTMGSYMTMQGTNLQTVGKVLGHKNSASTLIYSRLDVDTAREAMESAGREILDKE